MVGHKIGMFHLHFSVLACIAINEGQFLPCCDDVSWNLIHNQCWNSATTRLPLLYSQSAQCANNNDDSQGWWRLLLWMVNKMLFVSRIGIVNKCHSIAIVECWQMGFSTIHWSIPVIIYCLTSFLCATTRQLFCDWNRKHQATALSHIRLTFTSTKKLIQCKLINKFNIPDLSRY